MVWFTLCVSNGRVDASFMSEKGSDLAKAVKLAQEESGLIDDILFTQKSEHDEFTAKEEIEAIADELKGMHCHLPVIDASCLSKTPQLSTGWKYDERFAKKKFRDLNLIKRDFRKAYKQLA